jgi:hypothetical protein
MKNKHQGKWIPEIMYEEDSKIPFIMVPEGETNPPVLFIFISRETDEFEPGPEGEEIPIVEMDLHSYGDMQILKDNLDTETYDKVRRALGLEKMKDALEKGSKITDTVQDNIDKARKK